MLFLYVTWDTRQLWSHGSCLNPRWHQTPCLWCTWSELSSWSKVMTSTLCNKITVCWCDVILHKITSQQNHTVCHGMTWHKSTPHNKITLSAMRSLHMKLPSAYQSKVPQPRLTFHWPQSHLSSTDILGSQLWKAQIPESALSRWWLWSSRRRRIRGLIYGSRRPADILPCLVTPIRTENQLQEVCWNAGIHHGWDDTPVRGDCVLMWTPNSAHSNIKHAHWHINILEMSVYAQPQMCRIKQPSALYVTPAANGLYHLITHTYLYVINVHDNVCFCMSLYTNSAIWQV